MNTTTWTRRQHKGITTWEGVISRGPKGYRIIASARNNYEGDMANNEIRQMEYEADEEAFRLAEYAENTI